MRPSYPSVIQQLESQPYRFEFFQLMQILDAWLAKNHRLSSGELATQLRFLSRADLSFPASEIDDVILELAMQNGDREATLEGDWSSQVSRVWIKPAFMSLLGANGILPLHYTEQLNAHHALTRDEGPKSLFNMLSNRTLTMFYEAWRKFRLELYSLTEQGDRFSSILIQLSGQQVVTAAQSSSSALSQESLCFYAGIFCQRPMSTTLIQAVLNDYFQVPINLLPFQGGWQSVPKEQQTSLGSLQGALGYAALLGGRVWQRDLCVAIEIGPLRWSDFMRFLPGGEAMHVLEEWLFRLTGTSVEYEVRLALHMDDCGAMCLSRSSFVGLGWNSYLHADGARGHRQDVRYILHASAH